MLVLTIAFIVGLVVLVICTDQFVTGAGIVAQDMSVSPILVGAVILGCGTGLPELALAFYSSHESPWRQLFALDTTGSAGGLGYLAFFVALTSVLVLPTLFPDRIRRHSPLILLATIAFASLLRGSLDRYEGAAMLAGFAVGVAWIVHSDRRGDIDPFAPPIMDEYGHRAYIEAPVMTPIQVGLLRSLIGLFGTALGAQALAYSAVDMIQRNGGTEVLQNVVLVGLGSLLPHVVVSLHALRQHHEGLAVGNLIGSSLFNSLVIGGLVAIVRPYQPDGGVTLTTLGVIGATAVLSWMLLSTDRDMSRKQGVGLLGAYLALVLCTVV